MHFVTKTNDNSSKDLKIREDVFSYRGKSVYLEQCLFKKSLHITRSVFWFVFIRQRNVVFRDGYNFCKAFPEAQVHISHITSSEATSDMTYARVPLRKLCKNCPHPEKPFPYSKPISHIIYSYQLQLGINKIFLLKNQNQNILKILSNDRVVMLKNPLQITCDMQKKFLILKKLVKSQSGHTEKPFAGHMWSAKGFSAWPLCDLTSFLICKAF